MFCKFHWASVNTLSSIFIQPLVYFCTLSFPRICTQGRLKPWPADLLLPLIRSVRIFLRKKSFSINFHASQLIDHDWNWASLSILSRGWEVYNWDFYKLGTITCGPWIMNHTWSYIAIIRSFDSIIQWRKFDESNKINRFVPSSNFIEVT